MDRIFSAFKLFINKKRQSKLRLESPLSRKSSTFPTSKYRFTHFLTNDSDLRMYFAAALFFNFGCLEWFIRNTALYCFRNFALIIKILNLITTITQRAGKLFIAQKSTVYRCKQPLKKWRCGNFLQNDDGYFLVEQTV